MRAATERLTSQVRLCSILRIRRWLTMEGTSGDLPPAQCRCSCDIRWVLSEIFFSQILNLWDWKLHHLLETFSVPCTQETVLSLCPEWTCFIICSPPSPHTSLKDTSWVSLTPFLQALRLLLNSQSHLLHRLNKFQSCSLPLKGRVSSLDHILVYPGLPWAGDPKQDTLQQLSLRRAELCICSFLWLLLAYLLSLAFLSGSSGEPSLVTPADLMAEHSDSFFSPLITFLHHSDLYFFMVHWTVERDFLSRFHLPHPGGFILRGKYLFVLSWSQPRKLIPSKASSLREEDSLCVHPLRIIPVQHLYHLSISPFSSPWNFQISSPFHFCWHPSFLCFIVFVSYLPAFLFLPSSLLFLMAPIRHSSPFPPH